MSKWSKDWHPYMVEMVLYPNLATVRTLRKVDFLWMSMGMHEIKAAAYIVLLSIDGPNLSLGHRNAESPQCTLQIGLILPSRSCTMSGPGLMSTVAVAEA